MRIRNGFDSLFWSGLKTGAENYIFCLKSGQDLENWAAHPHDEFPGVPPPPDAQSTLSQQTPS